MLSLLIKTALDWNVRKPDETVLFLTVLHRKHSLRQKILLKCGCNDPQ